MSIGGDVPFPGRDEMSPAAQAGEWRVSESLARSSTYRGTMMTNRLWAMNSVGVLVYFGSGIAEGSCRRFERRPIPA